MIDFLLLAFNEYAFEIVNCYIDCFLWIWFESMIVTIKLMIFAAWPYIVITQAVGVRSCTVSCSVYNTSLSVISFGCFVYW